MTLGTVREWVRRRPVLAKPVRSGLKAVGKVLQRNGIDAYMSTHSVRKLQIGSLDKLLDGWLNTDLFPQRPGIVALDACRTFPIPDKSFDYVFSEHQFEHIAFDDGRKMLGECFRILKPGGTIRIAVPSLDPLIALYTSPQRTEEQETYLKSLMHRFPKAAQTRPGYAMNSAFLFHNHKFMYDRETLKDLAGDVGFGFKNEYRPTVSDDPHLRGIEFRTSIVDLYETIVLEFVRPAA